MQLLYCTSTLSSLSAGKSKIMNKTTDQAASSNLNKKSSVYISGFAPEVDEEQLLQAFVTFGDIIEIKIPHEPHDRTSYVPIV